MKCLDRWSCSNVARTFMRRATFLSLLIGAAFAISLTAPRAAAQPPLEPVPVQDFDPAAVSPKEDSRAADSTQSTITPLYELDVLSLIRAAQEGPSPASRPVPLAVPSPERPRSVDVPPFVMGPPTWPSLFYSASVFDHHPLYFEQPLLERFGHSHGAIQPAIATAHFAGSALALPIKMMIHPVWSFVRTPFPF